MKVRNGFVSNSSSSSFILDGSKYSIDAIRKIIELGLEIHKIANDQTAALTIDEICTIHEEKNSNKFIKEIRSFYSHFDSADGERYCEHIKSALEGKKVIIIHSVGDNSIPWTIQETLEALAVSRQHWG